MVDTDSQLITAVAVTARQRSGQPGGAGTGGTERGQTPACRLQEAMGDAAYGDGATRQTFARCGPQAGSPGARPARPEALSQG